MLSGPNNKSPFPFAWGGTPDWHELMCQLERYDVKGSSHNCYNVIIRYMSDTYECTDYVIYMT